ncbi:hypothetical protein HMPREF1544_10206 [Mucor circinelloides 1006PhL]|uniref:Uncharacterized protein n=1 Tax=Mucor circinelloides f. circinelloides (strain 1006PhL) TaxID=1220926 RepID=S2JKF8_MUCC1|nr:hypothetical protein HMPREF1544_10206 [Mucor circinelloides 1006PhL]
MSSMEEQFHMMQQQITALQEQLNGATTTPMQSADDTASLPLHSMGTRPRYDWSPSEGLTTLMPLYTLRNYSLTPNIKQLSNLILQWPI